MQIQWRAYRMAWASCFFPDSAVLVLLSCISKPQKWLALNHQWTCGKVLKTSRPFQPKAVTGLLRRRGAKKTLYLAIGENWTWDFRSSVKCLTTAPQVSCKGYIWYCYMYVCIVHTFWPNIQSHWPLALYPGSLFFVLIGKCLDTRLAGNGAPERGCSCQLHT